MDTTLFLNRRFSFSNTSTFSSNSLLFPSSTLDNNRSLLLHSIFILTFSSSNRSTFSCILSYRTFSSCAHRFQCSISSLKLTNSASCSCCMETNSVLSVCAFIFAFTFALRNFWNSSCIISIRSFSCSAVRNFSVVFVASREEESASMIAMELSEFVDCFMRPESSSSILFACSLLLKEDIWREPRLLFKDECCFRDVVDSDDENDDAKASVDICPHPPSGGSLLNLFSG
mmetsp:Transcript_19447/g.35762  ORF Transcript_19447/g.35762 Transcript_19447/m.35762 type:complete len:230 (-) Transcript_19447:847-1536(-)